MQLTVKGKQLDVGDALRSHVEDTLSEITGKYFNDAIDATVALSRQAHMFRADLSVHVSRNISLQSNAEAGDAYLAFDQAAEKMAKRIRRYKRRLQDHHKTPVGEPVAARYQILEGDAESQEAEETDEPTQPVIVAEMTTPLHTMTVGTAVMKLVLGELPALMFRNSAHGGLNMVYRRPDGNVGWVDPQGSGAEKA